MTGRIAGLSLAAGGLVTVMSLAVSPANAEELGLLAVAVAAVAAGGIVWLLPWQRWHWAATLSVIPVAFTLIALRNFFSPLTVAPSVFFVATFAWIGIGYRRFTSLMFAPLATAAYLLPFVARAGLSADYSSAAVVIPACVLIGETMAWIAERLRRTERALRDTRAGSRPRTRASGRPCGAWRPWTGPGTRSSRRWRTSCGRRRRRCWGSPQRSIAPTCP
jgi:hypothetical protein